MAAVVEWPHVTQRSVSWQSDLGEDLLKDFFDCVEAKLSEAIGPEALMGIGQTCVENFFSIRGGAGPYTAAKLIGKYSNMQKQRPGTGNESTMANLIRRAKVIHKTLAANAINTLVQDEQEEHSSDEDDLDNVDEDDITTTTTKSTSLLTPLPKKKTNSNQKPSSHKSPIDLIDKTGGTRDKHENLGGTNDIHENLARKRRLSESSNSNSSKKKKPKTEDLAVMGLNYLNASRSCIMVAGRINHRFPPPQWESTVWVLCPCGAMRNLQTGELQE